MADATPMPVNRALAIISDHAYGLADGWLEPKGKTVRGTPQPDDDPQAAATAMLDSGENRLTKAAILGLVGRRDEARPLAQALPTFVPVAENRLDRLAWHLATGEKPAALEVLLNPPEGDDLRRRQLAPHRAKAVHRYCEAMLLRELREPEPNAATLRRWTQPIHGDSGRGDPDRVYLRGLVLGMLAQLATKDPE